MILTSKLPNKVLSIKPWTIKQEKDVLLSIDESSTNKEKIDLLYSSLIGSNPSLGYQEKLYILLDTKSKISTNSIQLTYTCDNCKQMTETSIDISESLIIEEPKEFILEFKSCFVKLQYSDTLEGSVILLNDIEAMQSITEPAKILEYIEALEICEYDELVYFYSLLLENKPMTFNGQGKCLICNHKMHYRPSDSDLINTVTFITLKDYYTLLVDLRPQGFSIPEIENLMPFELELIVQTLNAKNTKKSGDLNGYTNQ